jgi:hypothetical protein
MESIERRPMTIEEVVGYRCKGLTLSEIARLRGTSKQAVHQLLQRHGVDVEAAENFRKVRPDLIAAKQRLLLEGITRETVAKMSGRDKAVSFGILYDKERLELGQSTANVANLHSIADRAIRAVAVALKPGEPDTPPGEPPTGGGHE